MKNYYKHIKYLLFRFLFILALFSVSRLLFYFFNYNYFNELGGLELTKICIAGLRFDISAIVYFNLLFILLSIIPGRFKSNKWYQKILLILFVSTNSIAIAANYIDIIFFDFQNKRLTADLFSSVWLGSDFINLLPSFIIDFWYMFIIYGASIAILIKFYPRIKEEERRKETFKLKYFLLQLMTVLLILGASVIGGRGGLQVQPLLIMHAAKYTNAQNVPIVLNTPFTIMTTFGTETFRPKHYFRKETLDELYSPVKNALVSKNDSKPNVVIIIMESFSNEYIGALSNNKGYTPFLDSLIKNSLVYTNAYANGKRSIDAMPSILSGLPSLTNRPYIVSEFVINDLNSIPGLLKRKGYQTGFFHGGDNGTMGFDQFAYAVNFDKYYGKNEYPHSHGLDGDWGIFDEPYLQYFGEKLSEFTTPFFATVFTLSSHHPYEVPEKYKGKFPKGNLEIHETIGYTDYSIQKFFELARTKEWYQNTLFVLVADHTAQAESSYYNNSLGSYAIPIIFFHPYDSSLIGESDIIAQQVDIMPTIMDYIGVDKQFICYGNSLLNDSIDHFSINYSNGIFQLAENDYILQFDGDETIALFDIKNDSLLTNNLKDNSMDLVRKYERKLKAIIQSYQERVYNNKLTMK